MKVCKPSWYLSAAWLALVILLAACGGQAAPTTQPPQAAPTEAPAASAAGALPNLRGELFNGSGNCAACHTRMIDEGGKDVSNDTQWKASMLANAARDPYWLATVRSEVNQNLKLSETIQQKCATCHMPQAKVTALAKESPALIFETGFLSPEHPLNELAMDGVACTLCHQVEPSNYGQPESFSGGFLVDQAKPQGERSAYGPYPVQQDLVALMQGASGFLPVEGKHIEQAELCGTCHDLITPYVNDQGEVSGEFPEQMIYSEWSNSGYREGSCQGCHMPLAQGGVQLSISGGPKRAPFFQHTFVGGNAYMGTIFQQNAEALQLPASPAELETIANLARQQIKQQAAALALEGVKLEGSTLQAQVVLQSKTGHKFPAGYPSRRAWLHITVLDKDGKVVFESGASSPDGSIKSNDNDSDPALFEPHYLEISAADQVQLYEAILVDVNGKVTTDLLRASRYVKDNRLLPGGFDLASASPNIAVQGEAAQDADFAAGGDKISLKLDLGDAQGPFSLKVELLFQTIGYRWAAGIIAQDTLEAKTFAGLYDGTPNLPLVAAQAEEQVGP